LVPIFAGAVAAALTAITTWALGRRKSSGTVATSEATDLWTASRTLQEALSAELVGARSETAQLRVEAVTLQTETAVLREEGAALRAEAVELREQMDDLKEELIKCNATLRGQRPRLRAKP